MQYNFSPIRYDMGSHREWKSADFEFGDPRHRPSILLCPPIVILFIIKLYLKTKFIFFKKRLPNNHIANQYLQSKNKMPQQLLQQF